MHMHDIEIAVIWFLSVHAGMILTMLLPRIVSESRSSGANQDACERIPAHHELHERAA